MKYIALFVVWLALSGCASHSIRIYDIAADVPLPVIGDAVAGGCAVLIDGDPASMGLTVLYESEGCTVTLGAPGEDEGE